MGKNKNKKSKANKQAKVTEVEVVEAADVTDIVQATDGAEEYVDDNNDQQLDNSTKKPKKNVLFSEEWDKLLLLRTSETDLRDEKERLIKEHEQKLKELNSKMKKNRKEQKILFDKMPNLHVNEVKVASKEKRKRSGKNTGGFNKECSVPPILAKYLEIEADKKFTRPAVFALLNEKFKKEGLKSGQSTVLDKKNAKLLGKTNGTEIPFSEGQTFLASFYKDINEVNV